jgi:hypothetical protein
MIERLTVTPRALLPQQSYGAQRKWTTKPRMPGRRTSRIARKKGAMHRVSRIDYRGRRGGDGDPGRRVAAKPVAHSVGSNVSVVAPRAKFPKLRKPCATLRPTPKLNRPDTPPDMVHTVVRSRRRHAQFESSPINADTARMRLRRYGGVVVLAVCTAGCTSGTSESSDVSSQVKTSATAKAPTWVDKCMPSKASAGTVIAAERVSPFWEGET